MDRELGRVSRFFKLLVAGLLAMGALGALLLTVSAAPAEGIAEATSSKLAWEMPLPQINDSQPDKGEPGVRMLESEPGAITLEFISADFGDFQIEQLESAGGDCTRLVMEGYGQTGSSGQPELPVSGALVGIPADAEVELRVLTVEITLLPQCYHLCPVERPLLDFDALGQAQYRGSERVQDAQAYASAVFSPSQPAELASVGFIRSQRVAQVRFYPFRYNPASGELQQVRRAQVQLMFKSVDDLQSDPATAGSAVDEGSFEDLLRHALVNYEPARAWRTAPRRQAELTSQTGWVPPSINAYKLIVDADGLYQVTPGDLQAVGVDVGDLDPRTFQVFNQGIEVATYVEGESDGTFDAGDALLFYGQGLNTKFTDTNVYWLTWGITIGRRMQSVDGTPGGSAPTPEYFSTTLHLEEDLMYRSTHASGANNDHWYWHFALASYNANGSTLTYTYPADLSHLATVPLSATLRGLLRNYDALPNQRTQVYLNGYLVEDVEWLPQMQLEFETSIPHSYLAEGGNTISVVVGLNITTSTDYEYTLINWFELDYYAVYAADGDRLFFDGETPGDLEYQVSGFSTSTLDLLDVTHPASPTRILSATLQPGPGGYTLTFQHTITDEHRYLALGQAQRRSPLSIVRDIASDLHNPANAADYILITPGGFYTALLPLVTHRQAQGMRTTVVDVGQIYDEFSYGVFDPQAIQSFLAYAYAAWARPAPAYVLLVGDGHFDFKDNFGWGTYNPMPPYLGDLDPWMGEVAADNRYVCVSGGDGFPDMHLGRLPVRSEAETSALVAKLVAYEQSPASGDWISRVLFVADNYDPVAGDFAALSDIVVNNHLPPPYMPSKVYYLVTHPDISSARSAIIAAINDGRLIVNYIGHSGVQYWASEKLFQLSTIASLNNAGRLPLMLPMTCLEGNYTWPKPPGGDYSCVGESVVRAANKGALASWSPTGLGLASGHDILNATLFDAVFHEGIVQLGPATTLSKLHLYQTGSQLELLDTYLLFGDPASWLNVLKADVGIAKARQPSGPLQPGDLITYALTYSNSGPATAYRVVISDPLPAALRNPTVTATSGPTLTLRSGSPFVWDVSDLAAGQSGRITLTAHISSTFEGVLTNSATITSTAVETQTWNNASSVASSVIRPLVADFTAVPRGGLYPLTVAFSDVSTGTPGEWLWDFGDPAAGPGQVTSTQQHPTHTYVAPGVYTVTLTVSNITGSSVLTRPRYIHATPLTVIRPISGPAGLYIFDDVCARLYFSDSGNLSQVTITLIYTYPTGPGASHLLPRRYDISGDATLPFTAALSVCYEDEDVTAAGITNEGDLSLYRHSGGGVWQEYASSVDPVHNWVTATQISGFSVWAIGDSTPTTVALHRLSAAVRWLGPLTGLGLATLGLYVAWAWRRKR